MTVRHWTFKLRMLAEKEVFFLEEEYQKLVMRAKENSVRRKFMEVRPGCSPSGCLQRKKYFSRRSVPKVNNACKREWCQNEVRGSKTQLQSKCFCSVPETAVTVSNSCNQNRNWAYEL